MKGHSFTACEKTPRSASEALKGRGFSRALHRFSKTYGTAGKPCPFKAPNAESFSASCSAVPSVVENVAIMLEFYRGIYECHHAEGPNYRTAAST